MKKRKSNISFAPPQISADDIRAVVSVLKSGWITTGPKVKEFEKALCKMTGARGAVCTTSGTASLWSVLKYLNIGKGDEVITSPFTYTASASCIEHVGATIRFADVFKDGFHMDPEQLAKAITKRTKAVIPVDYAGVPCDYRSLYRVLNAKKYLYRPRKGTPQTCFNRPVILADAAHSLGAMMNHVGVGNIADFTAFSFHAVKNLTTAEGGAVLFKKVKGLSPEAVQRALYLIIMHGQDKDALEKLKGNWRYDIRFLGYKYNMTDIQAALGLSQLGRYKGMLKKREILFAAYQKAFQGASQVQLLAGLPKGSRSAHHLMPVRILGYGEEERDQLMRWMQKAGIAVNVHFVPLPLHSAYQKIGFRMKNYPQAYATYQNLITLPLHLGLSRRDVRHISQTLLEGMAVLNP